MKTPPAELMRTVRMERIAAGARESLPDTVAIEEPLGIFVRYWYKETKRTESLAVTMRTPGHDPELAAGFLYSEGVIRSRRDICEIRHLGADSTNEILIELAAGVEVEAWRLRRTGFVHSSCGICGKQNIDALAELGRVEASDFSIKPEWIHQLPHALGERQTGFARTGGLHAAAMVAENGQITAVFEDIGRHNALDKLIGSSFLTGILPLTRNVLFLSSRGSFELVQKAATAGAPVLATVGSPSTLAIEAAERAGVTLIGFVRGERFNVYSGFARVRNFE